MFITIPLKLGLTGNQINGLKIEFID